MCVTYLGYFLLLWFPGVLHGKNITFYHVSFQSLRETLQYTALLSPFQHKVQHSRVMLPSCLMVILSLSKPRMHLKPNSLTPVKKDINQQWRVGGQQAHVKVAHGLLNHNA